MKDKVVKQDVKKDGLIYKLDFKFKFYPENVADEVIQDVTLKNLFVQVRKSNSYVAHFSDEFRYTVQNFQKGITSFLSIRKNW